MALIGCWEFRGWLIAGAVSPYVVGCDLCTSRGRNVPCEPWALAVTVGRLTIPRGVCKYTLLTRLYHIATDATSVTYLPICQFLEKLWLQLTRLSVQRNYTLGGGRVWEIVKKLTKPKSIIIVITANITSCVGGRHNMPPPPASWLLTL